MTMRKNLMFLFIAVFGVTLHSEAQESFKVKMPPFKKYVKVENGVNLRQAPTAESPQLVIQDQGYTSIEWSNDFPNGKPCRAQVLPVWDSSISTEVKDSKDWLCGNYGGYMVYVMKKFCKEVSLRPLVLPAPKSSDFKDLVRIETGKYKDYCIGLFEYDIYGKRVPFKYIRVGKYVDGMFIFSYKLFVEPTNSGKASFFEDRLFYPLSLSSNGNLDLRKLIKNAELLAKLMTMNYPSDCYWPITYYGVEGDNNWYSMY